MNDSIRKGLACLGMGIIGLGLSGCQSWSGGYPFSNPARVPAPGTGTYQVPPNYYNGSGQAPVGRNVSQFNSGSGTRPIGSGLPTTNLTFAPQSGSVQPAAFTSQPPSVPVRPGVVQAVGGGFQSGTSGASVGTASGSLSDNGVADIPSLQWGQP